MAFKQQPLVQTEYAMTIIKDLGRTTATEHTTALARYAIFECTECKTHFKARCGGKAAKLQRTCKNCTEGTGVVYHPLYAIWNGIKQRCYNPKRKDYKRYGAVGVTMCNEWKDDVDAFYLWCIGNGWKPELVIDKDIKCRELGITPAVYSPDTISFISARENAEEASAKEVNMYTLKGEYLRTFTSCVRAAESVNKPKGKSNIANCCRKISKSAYGYVWKYKHKEKTC